MRYLVLCVLYCVFSYEFQFYELQQLICIRYAIKRAAQVLQCFLMIDHSKRSKGIPLAGVVTLRFQEGQDEVRGIWY